MWRACKSLRRSTICCSTSSGGVVDDVIFYRLEPDGLFHLRQRVEQRQGFRLAARTRRRRCRGRKSSAPCTRSWRCRDRVAEKILQPLTAHRLAELKTFHFRIRRRRGDALPGGAHRLYRRRRDLSFIATATRRYGLWDCVAERGRAARAWCPRDWARAIRCGWKRPIRFTAMSWTTPRRRWKRAWNG